MEEQKKVGKEVKMTPQSAGAMGKEASGKMDYKELNKLCGEMQQQLQYQDAYIEKMHKRMKEMQDLLQYRRMDYLLQIISLSIQNKEAGVSFNKAFVQSCIDEIEEAFSTREEDTKGQ